MSDEHPARLAAKRSLAAVQAKDKTTWLSLFADDAVIEDPVGVSPIDPTGKGHRGREAIGRFWDRHIASSASMGFEVRESHASGDECANVYTITIGLPNGMRSCVEGIFVYRVNDAGKLLSMRGIWEFDRMLASMTAS